MLVTWVRSILPLLCVALATSSLGAQDETGQAEPTRILSATDVERLKTLQGMTLQWLDWDERGPANVIFAEDGRVILEGSHFDVAGAGVRVSGVITEIGKDYFLLDGRIQIIGTPDADRRCDADKVWRFAATQRRAYHRLREFEWCDYLTDYIDFYFAPGLR